MVNIASYANSPLLPVLLDTNAGEDKVSAPDKYLPGSFVPRKSTGFNYRGVNHRVIELALKGPLQIYQKLRFGIFREDSSLWGVKFSRISLVGKVDSKNMRGKMAKLL